MIIDHKPCLGRSGVTLVELMVSVVILSIGILGLVATFGGIQRAVQNAKNKTLASTLAQEKMQILKQKNYYQVLVTPEGGLLPHLEQDRHQHLDFVAAGLAANARRLRKSHHRDVTH